MAYAGVRELTGPQILEQGLGSGGSWGGGSSTSARTPTIGQAEKAIQSYYPPNRGFLGRPITETLKPGTMIDRYGGADSSRFFSPAGTPQSARSLPPSVAAQELRTFKVIKPFEVETGTVAPAFNQFGLGTQYRASLQLRELLREGFVEETK